MSLFKNEFRTESARLPDRNYAAAGWYFVTLCTRRRQYFFGEIRGAEMHLSPIGEIVAEEWLNTERVRPQVRLDSWVVMPNHLHGIIVIRNPDDPPRLKMEDRGRFRLMPDSLGSILGQFKSVCTKRIRAAGNPDFGWQPRYYDHVIRTEESIPDVRTYILANPARWEAEKNLPENLYM